MALLSLRPPATSSAVRARPGIPNGRVARISRLSFDAMYIAEWRTWSGAQGWTPSSTRRGAMHLGAFARRLPRGLRQATPDDVSRFVQGRAFPTLLRPSPVGPPPDSPSGSSGSRDRRSREFSRALGSFHALAGLRGWVSRDRAQAVKRELLGAGLLFGRHLRSHAAAECHRQHRSPQGHSARSTRRGGDFFSRPLGRGCEEGYTEEGAECCSISGF
jgi:hypothetical protein